MRNSRQLCLSAFALAALALAHSVTAAPITVLNHSFEFPALPDSQNSFVDGPNVDDWDEGVAEGVEYFNGTSFISPAAYHIKQFAWVSGGGTLGQDTGATL